MFFSNNRNSSQKDAAHKIVSAQATQNASTITEEPERIRHIQVFGNPNQDNTTPERDSDYLQPISPDSVNIYETLDESTQETAQN